MNRIKELRQAKGWKQSDLGEMLKVQKSAISKYETGKIPLTAETITTLTKIFNVSADYLLGNTDIKLSIESDTKNEISLQNLYNDLTPEGQEELMKLAEMVKRADNARTNDNLEILEKKA